MQATCRRLDRVVLVSSPSAAACCAITGATVDINATPLPTLLSVSPSRDVEDHADGFRVGVDPVCAAGELYEVYFEIDGNQTFTSVRLI